MIELRKCEYRYHTDGFRALDFFWCNLQKKPADRISCIVCYQKPFIPMCADSTHIYADGTIIDICTKYSNILL